MSSSALIPPGVARRQREGPSLGSTPWGTHLGHCYSSWHWRHGAGDLAEWNGIRTSAGRCFFPTCLQFPFLLCFPKAGSLKTENRQASWSGQRAIQSWVLRSAISNPLPSFLDLLVHLAFLTLSQWNKLLACSWYNWVAQTLSDIPGNPLAQRLCFSDKFAAKRCLEKLWLWTPSHLSLRSP